MEQSLNDLEELAESIGISNLINGQVNLEKIIDDLDIRLIYGHYGEDFLGVLVHENDQFYIQINLDKLKNNPGRTRFTIAHELGHYYNDNHRIQLEKGVSVFYYADSSCKTNIEVEKKANHFASCLLMPKVEFLEFSSKHEPGLNSIINLKHHFNTSIESTVIRYITQDIIPCMAVKWNSNLSYTSVYYSKSFSDLTGIKGKPIIKVTANYMTEVIYQLNQITPKPQFFETATQLSKWVATISPGSKNDLIGLEQTVKLGNYGAITFLMFP